MARKGSKKVRTGCKTCKIRKVKCDEEKPVCRRCTDTGRTCDGYGTAAGSEILHPGPVASVRRVQLPLQSDQIIVLPTSTLRQRNIPPLLPSYCPGIQSSQGRALQFFSHVVAPALSYSNMDEFWTTTVLQMACNEPAVRHALTAISIVFNMSCVRGAAPTDTSLIGKNQLATDEYNKAIRHMVHGTDDHLALLVCMIFVSLEILQQNRLAAIDHCRHGVLIMNSTRTISPWARDKILPTLRRLAAFPYYFGSEPDSFPALSEAFEPNDRFHTLDDALTSIDYWTACAIRLIRRADPYLIPRDCDPSLPEEDFPDPYRGGPLSGTSIPEEMLAEQRMVLERARGWQDSMSDYLSFSAPTLRKEEESWTASLLQMRCLILQVWLTAQYTSGEGQLAFDRHMDSFRQVVALGYEMQAKRKTSAAQRTFERATNPSCRRAEAGRTPSPAQPGFASEMGVLPILFFTTLRCRDLELRLQALALLWDMSTEREGLFRVDSMACTARRFVELEHDIDLTGWRWKDSGDSVREFRNAAFSDGPAAWSHDPLEAVPERMRLWDALDPILMRAVLKKGSGGLTKEQAPARGRIVRFIRYDDGKLQSWEESLPISV